MELIPREEGNLHFTMPLQALEQEKYSLQREVELKTRILDSVQSELDDVKKQQRCLMEQQEAQLERSHAQELSDNKNQV